MIASATSLVPTDGRIVARRLHVVGDVLPLADDLGDRALEAVGRLLLLEVPQHQHPREHLRHRIDLVLPGVLRRGAVRRLEDRDSLAEVRARREPEPADHPGAEVRDDVAVQVRQDEHVVLLRPLHELHAHVVDDAVVELDVVVLLGDLACDAQIEPVRELHDVRLVDGRDLAAAVAACVVERELDDPAGAAHRDRLDRDAGVIVRELAALRLDPVDQLLRVRRALLVLDPGVEVLGVLADDDQVDVLEARPDAGIGLARADLRVEVEALAQGDVDGAEAAADRGRDRPLERDAGLADGVEDVVRQRVAAVLLHHVGACLADIPVELDARRFEDATSRLGQFRPGSVPRDEDHAVAHGCVTLPTPDRVPRRMTLIEAAAQADELAQSGAERELATLRQQWDEEVEAAARSGDYRERAVAYRAIGQFRFRQKLELLRRGLDDESPVVRGSALVSVQQLSKDSPGLVNGMRPLLHTLASTDPKDAVRRLAIVCLRNGSAQRETIVLLNGLAEDDELDADVRKTARAVAAELKKKAGPKG